MCRETLLRLLLVCICALFLCSGVGCGEERGADPESAWKEEVDSSLNYLLTRGEFSFRLRMETWVHTPGHSLFGEERGEGDYRDGDFSVHVVRSSPQGEEEFTVLSRQGEVFLREGDREWPPEASEMPNPLYDPMRLLDLVGDYTAVSLQEEGDTDGASRRLYMLQYGGDKAQSALSRTAWSYFSNLEYAVTCRLLLVGGGTPPAEIQLEIVGLDRRESLQRLTFKLTFQPYYP